MRDLNEGGFRDQVIKIGLDTVGVLCNFDFDKVKLLAMDVVQEKGADRCNVEDVVQEVAPRAVGLVPDNCRKSIAKEIKRYLKDECDDLN